MSVFVFNFLCFIGYFVEIGVEYLNVEIIKVDIGFLIGGRVVLYIFGVLVMCKDFSNFYDFNLIKSLKDKLIKFF